MKVKKDFNSRTFATRMAIGDAILDELEEKEFSKIKVFDERSGFLHLIRVRQTNPAARQVNTQSGQDQESQQTEMINKAFLHGTIS